MAALRGYGFPGNVRELENILKRALAMSDVARIGAGDLRLPTNGNAALALGTRSRPPSQALAPPFRRALNQAI